MTPEDTIFKFVNQKKKLITNHLPYLLERTPMLERVPPSNERTLFLSKGALVWTIVFKGDAHLGVT